MKVVLLVDSSKSFLKLVEIIVKRLGYQPVTSKSAAEAHRALRQHPAEMVICEAKLPDAEGVELCRSIKADPVTSGIVVVMVSTDGSRKTRDAAFAHGCAEYLAKPVTTRQLFQVLEDNIGKRRRRKIRTDLEIQAEVREGERSVVLSGNSFGEGGVFLKSHAPLPVGSELDLSFALPENGAPVNVRGEVVYTFANSEAGRPAGMGVKFIKLDKQTDALLAQFVERYLTRPDPAGPVPSL